MACFAGLLPSVIRALADYVALLVEDEGSPAPLAHRKREVQSSRPARLPTRPKRHRANGNGDVHRHLSRRRRPAVPSKWWPQDPGSISRDPPSARR